MDLDKQNSKNIKENVNQFKEVKPTDSKENALQEKVDKSVLCDIVGEVSNSKYSCLGLGNLRPMTLASVSILKRLDSPLINEIPVEEIDDIFAECAKFVLAHSLPTKDILALCRDSDKLDIECLKLMEGIPVSKSDLFTEAVLEIMNDSVSTQVDAEPEDSDDVAPSGND